MDGQLGLLDGLSAELQKEILLQAIDEAGDIDATIGPMLESWRDGDEAGLERSLEEDFDGYPELADVLIYRRNAAWANQVSEMLRGDQDVLLVVGAHAPRGRPRPARPAREARLPRREALRRACPSSRKPAATSPAA